eukprot:COSAG01_NODE_558_length_15478_cov_217.596788_4_plen_87_part_00
MSILLIDQQNGHLYETAKGSIMNRYTQIYVNSADWSETKIQDLVLFRNQSENSMTQLARATEVADCMYSRCLRTFSCEIVRTVSQL